MTDTPPDPAFSVPAQPDPRAVAFLEGKSVQRSWRWPSIWREEHARAFTLAGVWRIDVLRASHELVTEAVRSGESYEAFQGKFRARMEGLGFAGPQLVTEFEEGPRRVDLTAGWRTKVIFDTNVRQAYAHAEWLAIIDTAADFPALEYDGVPVQHNREHHKRFWGLVLPVEHVFWATHYPPNGFHCRCYVIQVSLGELEDGTRRVSTETELAKAGYSADPADWEEFYDPKTGRRDLHPPGVHPGFAYNVGRERDETLARLVRERVQALPEPLKPAGLHLVEQAAEALGRDPSIDAFLADPAAQRALLVKLEYRDPELLKRDMDRVRPRAAKARWSATLEALVAVRAYTGRLYRELNARARTGRATEDDRMFGALMDAGLRGLPDAGGAEVWRTPAQTKADADALWTRLESVAPGGAVEIEVGAATTQSRLSTTLSQGIAARFADTGDVLMVLEAPAGAAKIQDVSIFPEEAEVVLPAGLRFELVERTVVELSPWGERKSFRVIRLRAIR